MLTIAGGIILAIIMLLLFGAMFSGFAENGWKGLGTMLVFGTILLILVSCMS